MALVHRVGWDARFGRRSEWMWPLRRAAEALRGLSDWPTFADLDALYAALTQHLSPAEPLRFADNGHKRDRCVNGRIVLDRLYDGRIALHRQVPTRERDWHDVFNALCFATFPRAKLALHRRQFRVLQSRLGEAAERLPPARTREQDALTLLDEGGVVIAATDAALRGLRAAPRELLADALEQLERRGVARTVPFGHALFEHLVEGLPAPGGGTRLLPMPELPGDDTRLLQELDLRLSAELARPDRFCAPHEELYLRFNRIRFVPAANASVDSLP